MNRTKWTTLVVALAAAIVFPLAAQERAEPREASREELSTRRAPDEIRLAGQTVNVTGRKVSPLVAAANQNRAVRSSEVRINNENLARSGPGLGGMTGGTPVAEVPEWEDSRKALAEHDAALAQWERQVRDQRARVRTLQSEVTQLEAAAGTIEERISNEDDPAAMETLSSSEPQVRQRLSTTSEELERERQRAEQLARERPKID